MNNNFNNNELRYSQLSSGRTYSVCKHLSEITNGIQSLINHMARALPRKSVQTCKNDKPKLKSLKDEYTHQNIENGTARYLKSYKVFRQSDLKNADIIYKLALKSVEKNPIPNSEMNNLNQFCLFFFLGSLFAHIPGYEQPSSESYSIAISLVKKLPDFDLDTLIIGKLAKHQALPISVQPIQAGASVTLVNALCSKIFFEKGLVCTDSISELFTDLQCTKFSKLVLQLNALDALYHPRFKILFLSQMARNTIVGSYNAKNTVRILYRTHNDNRLTLLHELTHKAMAQVFYNLSIPYYKDNERAKQAYRESMRQVLFNLVSFTSLKNKANGLPLNELVEFCFGEESIENDLKQINDPSILKLFNKLHNVFGRVYSITNLDSEFITHALQYLADVDPDSSYIRCVQPLLNYIDEFVSPEMEKYINGHPCKKRLEDL